MAVVQQTIKTERAARRGKPNPGTLAPWTSRRTVVLSLAVIVAASLAVRGYRLSARSFWFDEAWSWAVTQFPFWEMLQRVGRDNHPPLYFILLKGWASVFGTSEFALRSLSVLLGGLTVIGVYLFTAEAFWARARAGVRSAAQSRARGLGLWVATLVALSVFQIRWAWEVRMYTLGTALMAFSSWALFRALGAPVSRCRDWALYGLLALLFAYTHYYALFSIAAQAIFLLGYLLVRARWSIAAVFRNTSFRYALLAAGILVMAWLPWMPFFLRQRDQVQADFWSRPVTVWDVPHICYKMFVDPEDESFSDNDALLAAGLCGAALLALLWRARAGEWYVFCAAVLPFGLSLLVSLLDTKVFYLRYFLFAHLFLLAALGALAWRVPLRLERGVVCSVVLAGLVWVYVSFWRGLDVVNKPGARAAAAFLASRRQPGEPVVVCSPLLYFPMRYHAGDRNGWYVWNNGQPVVHYEGGAIITPEDLITEEQLQAVTSRRAWAVDMGSGTWGNRTVPVPDGWVEKGKERFPEVYPLQGIVYVVEYEVAQRPRVVSALYEVTD